VRVAFTGADYASIPPTNKIFNLAGVAHVLPDGPETAVHEAVAPEPGDLAIRKVRVGAFSTTDLHDQLQAAGVDTLILAGISTSGVVLSTVRDAADRDYRLVVLADACADRDAEVHTVLTGKVFPRQADVVTVTELGGLWAAP
jgi:nicotinamidase-related amidase